MNMSIFSVKLKVCFVKENGAQLISKYVVHDSPKALCLLNQKKRKSSFEVDLKLHRINQKGSVMLKVSASRKEMN